MKKAIVSALFILIPALMILPAQLAGQNAPEENSSQIEKTRDARRFFVDCDRGATLHWALERAKIFERAEVLFRGTCNEVILINRDHLTLRGTGTNPLLIGLVDVVGASNVVIRDFEISSDENTPTGTRFGGVNAIDGSAVTVANMYIHDLLARGIRLINSTARLRDIRVENAGAGAYVFRGSSLAFEGSLTGIGGNFGMSLVDSNAFARDADFEFRGSNFGLIIQISSGFEHVEGSLTVEENAIGLLLSAQGTYAFGSFIEANNNTLAGVIVDELSSMTPLNGAPGGGPSLTVTNNTPFGILMNRGSTLRLSEPTVVTGNSVGMFIDTSTLIMAGTRVENNDLNMDLSFGSWVTFQSGNIVATPYQCDGDVLTRGEDLCSSAAASAFKVPEIDLDEVLRRLRQLDH